MNLEILLERKRDAILKDWLEVALDAHHPVTAEFMKKEKNNMENPVGHTISQGMEHLFDGVLLNKLDDAFSTPLQDIVRIRAAQNFAPSQAVSFIFILKKIIRKELASEIRNSNLSDELFDIEGRIDGIALLAFDLYIKQVEKIYEIRTKELRNETYLLLRRANLLSDFDNKVQSHKKKVLA